MSRHILLMVSILLGASLAFYGNGAVAGAHLSGTTFSMVICSDGIAQTIEVALDGNPVQPIDDCGDCLSCGVAFVNAVLPPSKTSSLRNFEETPHSEVGQDAPTAPEDNKRPKPRAPPARTGGPDSTPISAVRSTVRAKLAAVEPRHALGGTVRRAGRALKEPAA